MRVHVVYAHPEPKSFCATMKDTTVALLTEARHQVTLSDLYAERFNPVASPADFAMRRDACYLSYALEQRYAIETRREASSSFGCASISPGSVRLLLFASPISTTMIGNGGRCLRRPGTKDDGETPWHSADEDLARR
jgi:hypothetical protein